MTVQIRNAQREDAGTIEGIVHESFALYRERMDSTPAPLLADYSQLIDQGHVSVAVDGPNVLGALVTYRRGNNFHVETVAVSPAAQGRRIGRLLMDFAESCARDQGLETVELYTNAVMTENFPFYERLGYEIVGEGMENGFRRIFFHKAV